MMQWASVRTHPTPPRNAESADAPPPQPARPARARSLCRADERRLIVNRAARRVGVWALASENRAVEPEPWPEGREVVGKVVWVAHTLVRPRQR